MRLAGIVEGRHALEAKLHAAANDRDSADEPVAVLLGCVARLDGHEVDNLTDGVRRKEAGDQYVCVGVIELLGFEVFFYRADTEVAAFARVEDRGKDSRRIEMRETHPVYRAIDANKCRGVHVTDKTVVFNGQIAHT